jgi:hypothetical protein
MTRLTLELLMDEEEELLMDEDEDAVLLSSRLLSRVPLIEEAATT